MLLSLLTENRTLVLNFMIAFSVLIFRAAGGFDLVKRRTVCYPSNTMPLTVSHLGVALLECDPPVESNQETSRCMEIFACWAKTNRQSLSKSTFPSHWNFPRLPRREEGSRFLLLLQAQGHPFVIETPDNRCVFVSSEKHIREIDTASPNALSLYGASAQVRIYPLHSSTKDNF